MMDKQRWHNESTATIQAYYEEQRQALTTALLSGASREEMKEKGEVLSQLSLLLYQRICHHPAEHENKREKYYSNAPFNK